MQKILAPRPVRNTSVRFIVLKTAVNLDDYVWPDIDTAFFAQAAEVITDGDKLRA